MFYRFPILRTIDDVLPHIEGREEFVVAERDFGTVINYVVAKQDTFDMTGPDDLGGAIRRECRGLIFDKEGILISRPFHKFFNIGEREETQEHLIDTTKAHTVMEKMDGSMIRPFLVDGYLRLGTKMGITNISMDAEVWLAQQDPQLKEELGAYCRLGFTPLFEWISPDNKIVLDYSEPKLVLLAFRSNLDGVYVTPTKKFGFDVPDTYGSIFDLASFISTNRKKENREGDIIRFTSGYMVKLKNDWYVRLHKVLDKIRQERNVIDIILNEELDDLLPRLPEDKKVEVKSLEKKFWWAFEKKEQELIKLHSMAVAEYGDDRKGIATVFMPTFVSKDDAPLIFRMLDGKPVRDLLLNQVRKSLSSGTKWDQCSEWLGLKRKEKQ